MNASVTFSDSDTFFAPASTDAVSFLLAEYEAEKAEIEATATFIENQSSSATISYFLEGNRVKEAGYRAVSNIFNREGAIKALDAHYWQKTLSRTDVMDFMPAQRRDEWNTQIREMTAPEFSAETVKPTILNLLNMRSTFLAEKVDGIFKGLSHEHVTNQPQAFSKRMIFTVMDCYGFTNYLKVGLLADLRAIIAKFMGRDEPTHYMTTQAVDVAKKTDGWLVMDGGAMKIRTFKKGTAHIEIHPDMAWRLNAILASIYPSTIPESLRRKPVKQKKERSYSLIKQPLPFCVLGIIAGRRIIDKGEEFKLYFEGLSTKQKEVISRAKQALMMVGATETGPNELTFSYDPSSVIEEIVVSGCLPDKKSHQFYPTPENIAQCAVDYAGIGPGDRCLEPSAGTGNIAGLLPAASTLCVEVDSLFSSVLNTKGYKTLTTDFLLWAGKTPQRFDKIVMNPPYSDGRWQSHTEAAAKLVAAGGRLVAVLPSSAANKFTLDGFSVQWPETFNGDFEGTGIRTVLLVAEKLD